MTGNKHFILDFDSTITRVEALDELAAISLKGAPDRARILGKIKALTDSGMEGKISFPESLGGRIRLLRANRKHINLLVGSLRKKLSRSFLANRDFFKKNRDNIYVISGGFREFIVPVLKPYGIREDHIYANTFRFDSKGNITGADEKNPLAGGNGKAEQLKALGLKGETLILGDGYTDYKMKEACPGARFFAFTENVERKSAVSRADAVATSFDHFLYPAGEAPAPAGGKRASASCRNDSMRALLLENIHGKAALKLKDAGFYVETLPRGLAEEELLERIKDVHFLGVRSATRVTGKVIEKAERLMAVGAYCIGTNNIDLSSCLKRGVAVFNAPYSNTRSVAELVIGEIIILLRNVFGKSLKLHRGIWDKSSENSFEVRGKKLGIIGYGNIGSQVSVLAEAMGMEVYYYDITDRLGLGNARKCDSMRELLRKADIVTLHVDGRPSNRNLIGAREFGLMRKGSFFLNLSRGSVADLASLAGNIRSGKILGAAVDVFPEEPRDKKEKFDSELRNLPNVIMTPHIGGSTREAQENIAVFVSERLADYAGTGSTLHSVNFPQVKLPGLTGSHRFLHAHRNIPGMLSQINTILSDHGINIEGQYLKTNEEIGYVITDICAGYDKRVVESLGKIEGTIKFRVLY